ncbi:MAG: hypothetical protein JW839_17605 [Candidatus Lokiarchaeota archaeon]|nr:hypothetical protein [Candidatus Lokiarchaeota archaeon]
MDEADVRAIIARDPGLAGEIPADAAIMDVRAVDLEEAVRLSTEYPSSFRRHKGEPLHAATITYPDPATGHWRYRVAILASGGRLLLIT